MLLYIKTFVNYFYFIKDLIIHKSSFKVLNSEEENGILNCMASYEIIKGECKILISASHSCVYKTLIPESKSIRGEEKLLYITKNISQLSHCFGIFSTTACSYDPNFTKITKNDYKKELERIVKKNDIKTFIELDKILDNSNLDFRIKYEKSFFKSKELSYKIAKELCSKSLKDAVFSVDFFSRKDIKFGETNAQYIVKKMRIPSIQLEIGELILSEPELLDGFISYLSKIIIAI